MQGRSLSVLSIAGSDSGGGAGVQADLRACHDHGVWCATAITAVTTQDSHGVHGVELLTPELVISQADAVVRDLDIRAIKLGMLGSDAHVVAVVRWLTSLGPARPRIVIDPVMVSTSGRRLLSREAVALLRTELIPMATLTTPNVHEAAVLAQDAGQDVESWCASQRGAVLLTGGDDDTTDVVDRLFMDEHIGFWRGERVAGAPFHGTGCMLSSAVAARLCLGEPLRDAVGGAITYVQQRLRHAIMIGGGARVGGWNR